MPIPGESAPVAGTPALAAGSLAAGSTAPDFSLPDDYGGTFVLHEALADTPVLLVFYPFAFSPVCGTELRDLEKLRTAQPATGSSVSAVSQDSAPRTRIVAVSTDSKYTLAAWAAERGTGFDLVSDFWPHGEVARAYGVFDEAHGMARRGTFLIGQDGRITRAAMGNMGTVRDFSTWLTAEPAVEGGSRNPTTKPHD